MAYDKIKFKKGLRAHLPQEADVGEPLYCTDTNELFIGTGAGRMPIGIIGPKGDKGDPGLDGTDGKDGTNGARGPEGPKGERGDIGPQGIQGERGERGPKGDAGRDGCDGINGARGEQGPIGKTGPAGPQGVQGPRGPKGEDGKSIQIRGQKDSLSDLPPNGSVGDGWLVGGNLHVWDDTAKSWINVGRIQGPQGEKGEAGDRGPAGPVNISDSITSEDSNTAASLKALSAVNKSLAKTIGERVAKTGDVMTGSLAFQGICGLVWKAGRQKESSIFWNANTQNDYGMEFVVDGQSQFLINKNTKPRVFIDGKWHYLVTDQDLSNLSSGGDFVGKKVRFYNSPAIAANTTSNAFSVNVIGKENIAIIKPGMMNDHYYSKEIKLYIDDALSYTGTVRSLFKMHSSTSSGSHGFELVIPFEKNIRLTYKNDTNYSYNLDITCVQYYKQ